MPPSVRKKRGRLSPVLPAISLAAALRLSFALARFPGGSFWIEPKPQNSSLFAAASAARGGLQGSDEALRLAANIEERFGVGILCSFHTLLPISAYTAEACSPEECAAALYELERTLALYPEGFFSRIGELTGGVVIELCGAIRSKEAPSASASAAAEAGPCAVTVDCISFRLIALDVGSGSTGSLLMHELCHVIDACLDRAAADDPSMWNDEAWSRLDPPGFAYYMAYTDASGTPLSESADPEFAAEAPFLPENVYFVNRYSKTFPTEDRAVAFETLMRVSASAECMQSPHIRAKLSYYFNAIRYYFDHDGLWEGNTFWEEKLLQCGSAGE